MPQTTMNAINARHLLLILSATFSCFSPVSSASDTISPSTSLRDGQGDTVVSSGETFELGFFALPNSTNRYLGIWYKKISIHTVVWIANRDTPLTDSSGVVRFDGGNLTLVDGSARIVWSTDLPKVMTTVTSMQIYAQLLDSGNFVLRNGDDNSEDYLWQSFDHPADTLLPGMKLGWDLKTGLNRFLTSWKRVNDPSSGDYTFVINPNGSAQIFLSHRSHHIYRSGPWNGVQFSGVPEMSPSSVFKFDFVTSPGEVYYKFNLINGSLLSRLVINQAGQLERYTWLDRGDGNGIWSLFWWAPKDQCDTYEDCGPNGVCNVNKSPVCNCLKGFKPKSPEDWFFRITPAGCIRKAQLNCIGEGFLKLGGMKLPDTSTALVNRSMSLEECGSECLKSCSCVAYASADIRGGGTGCIRWATDLVDLREYSNGDGGQDLYIRVPASELENGGDKRSKRVIIAICVSVTLASVVLLVLGAAAFCKQKRRKKKLTITSWRTGSKERSQDFIMSDFASVTGAKDCCDENGREDLDLPLFDFETIVFATNSFSDINKLGRGGFGPVYKGKLADGQEIAVKRLSNNSGQGVDEFKNEVMLIAKLQHRNLVQLLGCCIQGGERMLIYEYMQNRSLDSIIFDETKRHRLSWQNCFNIITGVARGLLYLHQDSRFRIIHRDLKASNILLDSQMNPKISDFGMARIFGADQMEANTRRVVGTFGYMSPEYAMDGIISMKSDIFSFGVIVLEILTGKKNRGYYEKHHQLNLLGHVWTLWKEGKSLQLVDSSIDISSCPVSEVVRCVHVGLLCVQERAEDRPIMSSVVLMLGSESPNLPQPKQPGFCTGRSIFETDSSSSKQESCTINEITITMLESR